jgi:quinoprotein glucose dehydrogenase
MILMLAPLARAEHLPVQDPALIWSGVYTAAQAERGKALYVSHCSRCHGDDLRKSQSYPLAGEGFIDHWEASTLERLFNQIRQMPPGAPAAVDDGGKRDVMAYLLQQNGFPHGGSDLTGDREILAAIQIVRNTGPGPLKTGAVVRVTGCLTKRREREWELTDATEPERTALPAAPASGRPASNAIAVGNRTVALMNAFPNPAAHEGHRMLAVGFLARTPDGDAVNVVSLEMLGARCAP